MAAIKYTAGRIGLFAVFLGAMWFVDTDIFIKLIVALLLSAVASFFLLGRWRDDMANDLAARADRRKAERQRLRAALAGEDGDGADGDGAEKAADEPEKADRA